MEGDELTVEALVGIKRDLEKAVRERDKRLRDLGDEAARIIRGLLYNDDERGPGEWEAKAARFLSGTPGAAP